MEYDFFARRSPNGSKGMYLKVVISTAVHSLPVIFRALYLSLHPREQINDSARRVFNSRRDCALSLLYYVLYYVGSSPVQLAPCSFLFRQLVPSLHVKRVNDRPIFDLVLDFC